MGEKEEEPGDAQKHHKQHPPAPKPALACFPRQCRGGEEEEIDQRVFYRAENAGEKGGQAQRTEKAVFSGAEAFAAQQQDPGQKEKGYGVSRAVPGLLDMEQGKDHQQREKTAGGGTGIKIPPEDR